MMYAPSPISHRLLLPLLVGLAAGLALALPLDFAYGGLRYGGYYFCLFLVIGWGLAFVPVFRKTVCPLYAGRSERWALAGVLVFFAIVAVATPPGFRTLQDELSLQNISLSMHSHREAVSADKGYWVDGRFEVIKATLNKRPFLFPFLVSLVHDFTGYRIGNVFALNLAIGLAAVATGFTLFLAWFGRAVAIIAVTLLAASPLFLLSVRSGGFEALNFLLLGVVGLALVAYRSHGGRAAEAFLVLTAVLLAYVRYESGILLVPLLVYFWWRCPHRPGGQLSTVTLAAPLLMVPAAWVLRCGQARVGTWGPAEAADSMPVFSAAYLPQNIADAVVFFFGPSHALPSNFVLALAGAAGLLLFLSALLMRGAAGSGGGDHRDVVAPGAVFWLCLIFLPGTVVFAYFWSSFLDPLARRMALPLEWLFAFGLAYLLWRSARAGRRRFVVLGSIIGISILGVALPSLRQASLEADDNQLAVLENWKVTWFNDAGFSRERCLVIDTQTKAWTAMRVAALPAGRVASRMAALELQFRSGRLPTILVVESLLRGRGGAWFPEGPPLPSGLTLEAAPLAFRELSPGRAVRIRRVSAVDSGEDLYEAFWEAQGGLKHADTVYEAFKARLLLNLP